MKNIDNDTSKYFLSKLRNLNNPIILELGVNRGGSTAKFLKYINDNGGKLYSIDIKDCSKIINDELFKNIKANNWKFLKSNDLNIEYILEKFPLLKNGIDVLYVDSYHDETHVKKTLEKWFVYIKKNGYIFFDDTESLNYRKSKNFTISVNNDAINDFVKEFYDNNNFQLLYIKYFKGSGLSEFTKLSDLGSLPVLSKKVWKYNSALGYIYLLIKKILYFLKSKDKS